MSVESKAVLDRRLRTCQECGYVCKSRIEYHPYVFCVLVKAGFDPWQVVDEFAALREDVR